MFRAVLSKQLSLITHYLIFYYNTLSKRLQGIGVKQQNCFVIIYGVFPSAYQQ